MAERRMFAKSITNSAKFLRMPATTRLLYYDLGMNADDDGVVEAFSVLRLTGAQEDDLRVLVSRGYITILNEDLVSLINDWKTNNFIRPDRYHPSIYSELLVCISENDDSDGIPVGIPIDIPIDIPKVNQLPVNMDTEVSIGKASKGKASKGKARKNNITPQILEDFEYLWNLYPKKQGKQTALKAYESAVKRGTTKEEVETGIRNYIAWLNANHTDAQYIKNGDTFFRGAHWQNDYTITGVNTNNGIFNKYGGISGTASDSVNENFV